jgi:hypothetical protein
VDRGLKSAVLPPIRKEIFQQPFFDLVFMKRLLIDRVSLSDKSHISVFYAFSTSYVFYVLCSDVQQRRYRVYHHGYVRLQY